MLFNGAFIVRRRRRLERIEKTEAKRILVGARSFEIHRQALCVSTLCGGEEFVS